MRCNRLVEQIEQKFCHIRDCLEEKTESDSNSRALFFFSFINKSAEQNLVLSMFRVSPNIMGFFSKRQNLKILLWICNNYEFCFTSIHLLLD